MQQQQTPLRTRIGSLIGHTYPLLSGCGSFANSKLMRRFDPDAPTDVMVNLSVGTAKVPSHDYVGRAMIYVGELGRKMSSLIDATVKPGDCALDIGANLGLVSLRLAGRVGPNGMVHGFEPSPHLQPYLDATLAANPKLNIRHHACALGQERSVLPLHVPLDNAGAATLRASGEEAAHDTIDVPVYPLTEYAADHNITKADFIKIDVEGFEAEVILGAVDFIDATRPNVIVLEEHAHVTPGNLPPALKALSDLSYDIYAMPRRLFRLALTPIGDEAAAVAHDYVAISKSSASASIRARLRVD